MSWYYAKGSEKLGPLSDADFEAHRRNGQIQGADLVWKDGMADWVRLDSLAQQGNSCAECGKAFPDSELISYQGFKICAECKPVFLQKLKEGLNVGGALSYAGFWTRFSAVFIDGIILYVAYLPVTLGVAKFMGPPDPAAGQLHQLWQTVILAIFNMAVGFSYEIFMIGKYQATLGKRVMGIKVVGEGGSKISYGRACGRVFAKLLNYFTLMIGFLMAGWDKKKQALHDRICGTYVIKA